MKKNLVSFVLVLCMMLALLPGEAQAAANSGRCGDNLTWSYDEGTLTISGKGEMYDYDNVIEISPWFRKMTIKNIQIERGVTSIGSCAFQDTQITTLTIPDTIQSIGFFAFYGCSSLRWLDIPNSVEEIGSFAFSGCISLTSISLPNALRCIEGSAFEDCYDLRFIDIPASLNYIEESAFENCRYLQTVYFSGSTEQWKQIEIDTGNERLSACNVYYNQCTVFYDPNGGTDNMWNGHATAGEPYILPNCTHGAPMNRKFRGWLIDGREYQPGDCYTFNANTTIQTLWAEQDYTIDSLYVTNGTVVAEITLESDSALLVVAAYDADGKLSGLTAKKVFSADGSTMFRIEPVGQAYRIKVFCLDDLTEAHPQSLCETRLISAV